MSGIIAWGVAIVLITLAIVSTKQREKWITAYTVIIGGYLLGYIILSYIYELAFKGGISNHGMLLMPAAEQYLLLPTLWIFLFDLIKRNPPEELIGDGVFSGWLLFFGFLFLVAHVVYGQFNLVFPMTGIVMGALIIWYEITKKNSVFKIVSICLALTATTYYCAEGLLRSEAGNMISKLSDSLVSSPWFLLVLVFFVVSGLARSADISEKKLDVLTKSSITITISCFLFYHPDIKASDFPVIKEVSKMFIALSDFGLGGYALVQALKARTLIA